MDIISLMVGVAFEINCQSCQPLPRHPVCPHVLLNPKCSPGSAFLGSLPMKEVLFMGPSTRLSTEHIFGKSFADFPLFWAKFPFPTEFDQIQFKSESISCYPLISDLGKSFMSDKSLLCKTPVSGQTRITVVVRGFCY